MNARGIDVMSRFAPVVAIALALACTAAQRVPAAAQDEVSGAGVPGQVYDTDWDGVDDTTESFWAMNPYNPDMDADGLSDGDEFFDRYARSDPTLFDTDGDLLGDGYEVFVLTTDPLLPDTDADGWFDNIDA